jgi:hypothetical protein
VSELSALCISEESTNLSFTSAGMYIVVVKVIVIVSESAVAPRQDSLVRLYGQGRKGTAYDLVSRYITWRCPHCTHPKHSLEKERETHALSRTHVHSVVRVRQVYFSKLPVPYAMHGIVIELGAIVIDGPEILFDEVRSAVRGVEHRE